jgi:hypothetical protein
VIDYPVASGGHKTLRVRPKLPLIIIATIIAFAGSLVSIPTANATSGHHVAMGTRQLTAATPPASGTIYNRTVAANWARVNWNNPNGSRFYGPNRDCTYFVSQALWAGSIPKNADWTDASIDVNKLAARSWIPGPTKNAALADRLKNYLVDSRIATIQEIKWSDNTAGGAQIGDIIGYDWDGPKADGFMDHLAMVTSLNAQGYPSVTQHSPSRRDRYWSWDEANSKWIQTVKPKSRVYLIHIIK